METKQGISRILYRKQRVEYRCPKGFGMAIHYPEIREILFVRLPFNVLVSALFTAWLFLLWPFADLQTRLQHRRRSH